MTQRLDIGGESARAAPSIPLRGRTISFAVLAGLVRGADVLLLVLAKIVSLAFVAWWYARVPEGPTEIAGLAGALAASLALSREATYTQQALLSRASQFRLSVKPLVIGASVLIACLFLLGEGTAPFRLWPVAWIGTGVALLAASRVLLAQLLGRWARAGRLARKVAIVGLSEFSHEFIQRLREEPHAYRLVGLYDDRQTRLPPDQLGLGVLGTVQDLVQRSREDAVDVIVVALPLGAAERIRAILDSLSSTVADIVLTTDLAGLHYGRTQFAAIGSNPVVTVRQTPLKDWRAAQKAALDYGVGLLAMFVLSPVMLLTALLIKLETPGPVLFRQPRLGFNNRLFVCYKFRSMHHATADLLADRQTVRGDARITRVGRVIRRFSIDELPQLFNVLNGTMSLVGPRPHAPNTKAADRLFTEVVQQYALRHRVKPGITGWAQVEGWRGQTSTVEQLEARVACDLFYIENWSVGFDLKVMVMTVLREIRSRHAF